MVERLPVKHKFRLKKDEISFFVAIYNETQFVIITCCNITFSNLFGIFVAVDTN